MEARKESGSFRRGEMSLARKSRPGDPRGRARAPRRHPPVPRSVRPSVRADHVAGRPAPEQHPRDREVREAADAPRHQLQLRVRHLAAGACRRAGSEARRPGAGPAALRLRSAPAGGAGLWGVAAATARRNYRISSNLRCQRC